MCRFLCEHTFSIPLGKYQGARMPDCMVRVILVCKKSPNCLPKWLYHFAFPPAMNQSPCCSTSPAFGGVSVLGFGHSNRCLVVSCFNLHFLVAYVFWITILYQKCCLQIFSPSLWLASPPLDVVFCRAEALILMESSLSIISFTDWAFGVLSKKSSPY